MNNLLAFEDRQTIRREYRRRRLLVGLSLAVALIASAVVLLAAIYGTAAIKLSVQGGISASGASLEAEEQTSLKESSDAVQRALAAFKNLEEFEPSLLFKEIIDSKPEGISLASFSYTEVSSDQRVVVIEGIAATRKSLIAFIDTLEANPKFASVVSPLSNVIKDVDAPFSITLSLAKTKKP
ncbi:MAG TPA: PilN domain-containing protein [Candidatus Paceibacterota bacterium]|nr:PilN domain-containing protein [Candidatus Paceibacterota bacterium]